MIVERISETMFTIDGELAELYEGRLEFSNGKEITYYQFRAVQEFLDIEENDLRNLAHRKVVTLLAELGIKREK